MGMEIEGSKILRMPEVCEITGLGKSTIYRKLSEGSFRRPPPGASRHGVDDKGHSGMARRPGTGLGTLPRSDRDGFQAALQSGPPVPRVWRTRWHAPG